MKRFSVVSRGDRNFGDSKQLSMSPAHGEGEKFIQSDVHRVSTNHQGYRNRYTGGPPLTRFSLPQIPLLRFLSTVRKSGGFSR